MMPNTSFQATHEQLRMEIDQLAGLQYASVPQAFTQAIQSFLSALDYEDGTLMRSHLSTALEALQQVVHEDVQKRLALPLQARNACRKIRDLMKGFARENLDLQT